MTISLSNICLPLQLVGSNGSKTVPGPFVILCAISKQLVSLGLQIVK